MTSPQDLERLSAYLDNQLSPREKAQLEARLEKETELKATLDDLRQTVRALRSLPVVKPPRHFTLSPQQVGAVVAPWRGFQALRLATAVAAMALMVVFAGDLAGSLTATMSPAAQAPAPMAAAGRSVVQATSLPPAVPMAAAPALPALPTEAAAENATVAQNAAPTTEDQTLGGAAGGGASGTEALSQSAPAPSVGASAVEMTPANRLGAGSAAQPTTAAAASTETPMAAAVLAAAPPVTAPSAAPAFKAAVATPPGETEAAAADQTTTEAHAPSAPTEALEAPTSAAPVAPTPLAVPEPSLPPTPSPWRYIEIGLALLTVGLAVATWISRKR
jgi:hypothetical protein